MYKDKLYQVTGLLLGGLLLVISLTGCSGNVLGQSQDEGSSPFADDRVVTVRITMDDEDWALMQKNARAEEYAKADFWFGDELTPDVAVRPKGNSSLNSAANRNSPRFSLKVDFNFFNSARTFNGLKKVNLNNGFSDPTLIRETLGYELFEQMGLPTPRTCFVDLWINDTHLGVYTMVEQIDKTFLQQHFTDATGNLYKPEMPASYLNWTEADLKELQARQAETKKGDNSNLDVNLGGSKLIEIMRALGQEEPAEEEVAAPQLNQRPLANIPLGVMPAGNVTQRNRQRDLPLGNMPAGNIQRRNAGGVAPGGATSGRGDYLQQMGLKTNENNPDHSALFRLLDVLNNEPDETFPEEIEKVLDVDQVLRFLAVSVVMVHLDNYIGMGHNYYLYEIDGKFTIIPWDLNMCFGTFNQGTSSVGAVNFYIDEPSQGSVNNRPLLRLLNYQPYLKTYHAYLQELIEGPFSEEVMYARIDALADLIRPYVEKDDLKFFTTKQFEMALSKDLPSSSIRQSGGTGPKAPGLKSFIHERIESVRGQLAGTRASTSGVAMAART
jgi:spore coat protein CotH